LDIIPTRSGTERPVSTVTSSFALLVLRLA
jgi:hypothetical protein